MISILKHLLYTLPVFFLYSLDYLEADETYWDSRLVSNYVHNSELQRRWAMAFLAPHLKLLKGNESILDIGCGDGKITADISKFIPQGKILGIDPSIPMLKWAQKQYSLLEYPNLSFQEGGFIQSNISNKFDMIICNCSLQHCSDQPRAFKNLANLLNPDGKLLIMTPAIDNQSWKNAIKTVRASSKWSHYWKNIVSRKFPTAEEYSELLLKVQLQPSRIKKVYTADPFVDRQEFLSFLLGTFQQPIPKNQVEEFYNEVIDEYLRQLPEAMQSNGSVEARFGRIEIEAIKEDEL